MGIKYSTARLSKGKPDATPGIELFLQNHFCTIFHEPVFNEIIQKNYRTDFYYGTLIGADNRLLALCPLHVVGSGWVSSLCSNPAMYEVPYGGWIYEKEQVSIGDLMQSIKLSFGQGLTYWSIPQIDSDDFSHFQSKTGYLTSIIDLQADESTIWDGVINSKRRNMVRKAEKNNITVRVLKREQFDIFYDLLRETYQAADLTPKPKDCYLQLFQEYEVNKKMLVMIAERDREPLAGIVLLRNRYFCHYWLGAGKKAAENFGQGELLQWEAIKWAKRMGSQYYDLCVVESDRLPNIARFKLGFSNRTVPFYCITRKKLGYRIGLRIRNVFG